MKKLSVFVMVLFCWCLVQTVYAQDKKPSKKTTKKNSKKTVTVKDTSQKTVEKKPIAGAMQQIIVTSKETEKKLMLYGSRDSLKFRVSGTANLNWEVSVSCIKKNAKTETWYKADCLEYFYWGMDTRYHYSIVFHTDGSVEVLQTKKGDHKPTDTFSGTYE